MSIGNARKFMQAAMTDKALRTALNAAPGHEARQAELGERELSFTDAEFDEAFRSLLVQCQTEDAADALQGVRMWWEMLRST